MALFRYSVYPDFRAHCVGRTRRGAFGNLLPLSETIPPRDVDAYVNPHATGGDRNAKLSAVVQIILIRNVSLLCARLQFFRHIFRHFLAECLQLYALVFL